MNAEKMSVICNIQMLCKAISADCAFADLERKSLSELREMQDNLIVQYNNAKQTERRGR